MGISQRHRLAQQQGFRCYLCGCVIHVRVQPNDAEHLRADEATIEHVVPRKHGGRDDAANLMASCHACNHGKGHLLPLDLDTVDGQDRALGLHIFVWRLAHLIPLAHAVPALRFPQPRPLKETP
jgi:hypothetical protein